MKKYVPAWYYQQFDADFTLEYPGEGYGGWKKATLPIHPDKTALIIMHAWDTGTVEQYPGWYRCVEYLPRANFICDNLYPDFLKSVRASGMRIIHVAAGNQQVEQYPGYQKACKLSSDQPREEYIDSDEVLDELQRFKRDNVFVGAQNSEDVMRGQTYLDVHKNVRPVGDEYVVTTSKQLYDVCKHHGINHLIYSGFAVNMCLTVSPGGFVDMSRHGVMCSIIKDLTTAVENKESCRTQSHKEYGLWYFSILSGFVYEMDDLKQYLFG